MKPSGRLVAIVTAATLLGVSSALPPTAGARQDSAPVPLSVFGRAASSDDRLAREALEQVEGAWQPGYAAIILELAELNQAPPAAPTPLADASQGERSRDRRFGGVDAAVLQPPRSPIRDRLIRFLGQQTGQRFDHDFDRWHRWIWSQPYDPHPDYALFKGLLYANIDPRMRGFFPQDVRSLIRLDEVEWGGVPVNGIPPLYYPNSTAAADADYLRDNHVIFGIAVNGEARAYPKRILAWHELAWDRLGGVELTIVYCTLCGTVIPYDSVAGGQLRRFGTSGLLYRSNKLMFDEDTMSLWSTFEGVPVIGPLVDTGVRLTHRPVVTTTWGEWRRRHPESTVLSLDTGHDRDYSEGAAYRDYFRTDRLMFPVPERDDRLGNKDEVLVMRIAPATGGSDVPVAISAGFLRRRPVFHTEIAGRRIVVITSRNGANRVYDAGDRHFTQVRDGDSVVDQHAQAWRVTEDALIPEGAETGSRPRLSAQRAFWFGWHAQFPGTLLVK